jgi:hypothetical protein
VINESLGHSIQVQCLAVASRASRVDLTETESKDIFNSSGCLNGLGLREPEPLVRSGTFRIR